METSEEPTCWGSRAKHWVGLCLKRWGQIHKVGWDRAISREQSGAALILGRWSGPDSERAPGLRDLDLRLGERQGPQAGRETLR